MKLFISLCTAFTSGFLAFLVSFVLAFAYLHDRSPLTTYSFIYAVTLLVATTAGLATYKLYR
jgi:hypothetical protein